MIKTNLFFRNFPISISSLVITIIICFIGFQEFATIHTHTPFFYQVFFVSHVLLFCINVPQICRYIKDYWSFQKLIPPTIQLNTVNVSEYVLKFQRAKKHGKKIPSNWEEQFHKYLAKTFNFETHQITIFQLASCLIISIVGKSDSLLYIEKILLEVIYPIIKNDSVFQIKQNGSHIELDLGSSSDEYVFVSNYKNLNRLMGKNGVASRIQNILKATPSTEAAIGELAAFLQILFKTASVCKNF